MKVGGLRVVPAERKLGWKPTAAFLKRLYRAHPRAHLMWVPGLGQWALVEKCVDGAWEPIARLEGRPNYHNTIGHLGAMRRLARDHQRWLYEQEEAEMKQYEVQQDDRIDEGHDRMAHALGSRDMVSFQKRAD